MQPSIGVEAAALVGAFAATYGTASLVSSARRRPDGTGRAYHLLVLGSGFAALSVATGLVGLVLLAEGSRQADRVVDAVAVGLAVAGLALAVRSHLAPAARSHLTLLDPGGADRLVERVAHADEPAGSDPLTGLADRRSLLRALRAGGTGSACVLLCLDLDGFNHVNDVRGHDEGDRVLTEVGRRLRRHLPPGDLAARLGGDEFAVLTWTDSPAAQRTAERLLAVLSRPYEHPAGPLSLSVSIGVADRATAETAEGLLRNAGLAMRQAKQRGRNRIQQYDLDYDRRLVRRRTLEHELRGAIERGELRLVFQPVVVLPSARPVGAEALLRWHHPELGDVGPDEFIPLAEECGMIAELDSWVLHEACRQLSGWLADGHDVWLSVNVSPLELHAPTYVTQVIEALRTHRVPPQRLVLEVTEHAVATDLAELIRRLRALRAAGVRIALDDFGAGYSSLGQLRRLPIDILKIDHSLVTEPERVAVDREDRPFVPMVDIVARLGHRLGLRVIAEGVTNEAEFAVVVEAGCHFGQGRLFGWGVPAERFAALLDAAPAPAAAGQVITATVQNVGAVDSSREMRQA